MTSIENLTIHFEGKLTVLNQALKLFSGVGHEDFSALFSDVDQAIDSVREELHFLKLEVDRQNQILVKLNELKTSCEKFNGHLQNALDNVPSRLPSCSKQKMMSVQHKEEPPVVMGTDLERTNYNDKYINFITVDDFENVPKYMKGRMQYGKVMNVIVKLNEAFSEKYKILKQKKSTLSDNNRKLHELFKSQENKDTKGVHFIVDRDVEQFTSLKMDNTTRNVLVMLRHCGVMHEIRGGGCVRYASYC